jgi:hypothetical protein
MTIGVWKYSQKGIIFGIESRSIFAHNGSLVSIFICIHYIHAQCPLIGIPAISVISSPQTQISNAKMRGETRRVSVPQACPFGTASRVCALNADNFEIIVEQAEALQFIAKKAISAWWRFTQRSHCHALLLQCTGVRLLYSASHLPSVACVRYTTCLRWPRCPLRRCFGC